MTGSEPAVLLRGVGKRYQQTTRSDETLLHRLVHLGRAPKRDLWALKDIDLEVAQGETMGIIGRNGSGKTTLLRMLSGVSAPTTGQLRVVGRVAPLIGIGVGFNNELTGRENVYANARLLGMSEAKIRRDFDAIAAFSEIEGFLDTPVKFYSSGMFLRLAFSVAIHTEPDVLVLDEILAVGDIAFQAKCMDKMREIQASGTTIVVVTHNLHTLDRIAPRAVLLSHGEVVYDGPTEQAIGRMHEVMQRESLGRQDALQQGNERGFVGNVDIQVDLVDGDGARQRTFTSGDEILLRVTASFEDQVTQPRLGVMVAPLGLGTPAYAIGVPQGGYQADHGPDRPMEAEVRLQNRLLAGGYSVHVAVHDERGAHTLGMSNGEVFYVTSNNVRGNGFVNLDAQIAVNGQQIDVRPSARLEGPAQAS